jgi:hypothetical protein
MSGLSPGLGFEESRWCVAGRICVDIGGVTTMFARRKDRKKTLLQDVSRAASRIAEESKSLADVARTELGDLGREVKGQANDKAAEARRATAARLAGAADAVEPERRRRRRRLPILLSAAAGGVAAMRVAKGRNRTSGPQTA